MVKNFKCITYGHSYNQPNPAIVDYTTTEIVKEQNTLSKEEERKIKLSFALIKKLTCDVTKQNVLEDHICLGYPLLVKRDRYGRL